MGAVVASSVLVGREAELAGLRDSLSAAASGSPQVLLLAGEAGIGKSRLAGAFEDEAAQAGFTVLRGDCVDPGGSELAYAPLVAALRDAPDAAGPRALADLGPAALGELARVLPGLTADPASADDHGAIAQTRLVESLFLLLRRMSVDRPVALVLEDLHWADQSTRTFLAFLARALRRERLVVLATYRTDDVHGTHPLLATVTELCRLGAVRRLTPAPLSREDLEVLAGAGLPPEVVAEIHARAGGNPFVAEELLAARRQGVAGVPETLRDAMLLRTDGLTPGVMEALRALAVIGHAADASLVARAADIGVEAARRALREGAERRLLTAQASGVTFRHALLRETLYGELLPFERAALHRAVALALLEQPRTEPAEVAHHAHAGDLPDVALSASVQAGLAAEALYAYAEAGVHFTRALSLWDDRKALPLDRIDLHLHAAEAKRYAGDYEEAVALCRAALALVDRHTEPRRAAMLLERLGQYHFAEDELPLACYDEALALLADELPSDDRARVLGARAMALLGLSRHGEARNAAAAAVAEAQACGAEAEEASARGLLGLALGFLGDHPGAQAELTRAQALAERAARPESLARLQLLRAEVHRLRGDTKAALKVMLDGLETARRIGVAGSFGRFMAVHAASDLIALGRWDEAEQRLTAVMDEGMGATARLMRSIALARMAAGRGELALAAERAAEARRLAADGAPAEFLPGVHAVAAEVALWEGRPEAAAGEVELGLAAVAEARDALNTPVLHWLGARAQADLAERQRVIGAAEARAAVTACDRLVAEVDALVLGLSPEARPPAASAYVAAARAERARAAGDEPAAAWQEAVAAFEALEWPYEMTYARWRHGEALAQAGARGEAREVLGSAAASAAALGARRLGQEIDALARRARIDLRAPAEAVRAPEAPPPAGLTARELEVLALLAEGLTNRQIGARLYMAPKTAGVHVSRILTKLDARNRVEAAGHAHRLGITGKDGSSGGA